MSELLQCLCCSRHTIVERGAYEDCSDCGWEDDGVEELDYDQGPNGMTLRDAQRRLNMYGQVFLGSPSLSGVNWEIRRATITWKEYEADLLLFLENLQDRTRLGPRDAVLVGRLRQALEGGFEGHGFAAHRSVTI